jgi:hypothetical protein
LDASIFFLGKINKIVKLTIESEYASIHN